MSNTKHTPEPWKHFSAGSHMRDNYTQSVAIAAFDKSKTTLIAGCFCDVVGGEPVAEANAARIVACVNAFANIEDPEVFMKQVDESFNATMELKNANDELTHYVSQLEKRIEKIRTQFAKYVKSEGCSCCRNTEDHEAAEKELGILLKADTYADGSGFDWYKYADE